MAIHVWFSLPLAKSTVGPLCYKHAHTDPSLPSPPLLSSPALRILPVSSLAAHSPQLLSFCGTGGDFILLQLAQTAPACVGSWRAGSQQSIPYNPPLSPLRQPNDPRIPPPVEPQVPLPFCKYLIRSQCETCGAGGLLQPTSQVETEALGVLGGLANIRS